jgi:hypothetical protein
MAEAQLQQFLEKVRQLNAFVALSEADPAFRQRLSDCASHQEVVDLASRCGFDIARRWGEPPTASGCAAAYAQASAAEGATGSKTGPGTDTARNQACQDSHPQDSSLRLDPLQAQAQGRAPNGAELRVEAKVEPKGHGELRDELKDGLRGKLRDIGIGKGAANSAVAGNGPGPNLLSSPCPLAGQERTEPLLATSQLRLELIHSCEFANPPGFWVAQREAEWVLLLQGQARLRFADEAQARQLQAGDSLLISPGRRHRVEQTDPAPGTCWLALFWTECG